MKVKEDTDNFRIRKINWAINKIIVKGDNLIPNSYLYGYCIPVKFKKTGIL